MMNVRSSCGRVRAEAEAIVRGELPEQQAARLEHHAAGCPARATTLGDARRAVNLLAAVSLEPQLSEFELNAFRNRTMATIRAEQAQAAAPAPWRNIWASLAAAAMVVLVVALLPRSAAVPAGSALASLEPAVADVAVSTETTADGVIVSWQGEGRFRVLRTEGRKFDRAEVTVVCGTSWTDGQKTASLVTYRVVREPEPCAGTAMNG